MQHRRVFNFFCHFYDYIINVILNFYIVQYTVNKCAHRHQDLMNRQFLWLLIKLQAAAGRYSCALPGKRVNGTFLRCGKTLQCYQENQGFKEAKQTQCGDLLKGTLVKSKLIWLQNQSHASLPLAARAYAASGADLISVY